MSARAGSAACRWERGGMVVAHLCPLEVVDLVELLLEHASEVGLILV